MQIAQADPAHVELTHASRERRNPKWRLNMLSLSTYIHEVFGVCVLLVLHETVRKEM